MPTLRWSLTLPNTSSKKALKPCDKRMIIVDMRKERPKDISKVCRLLKLSRSSLCYTSIKDDVTVMVQLENLAKQNPVEGFGNVTTASGIQDGY
ncbi:MAG: hypothetical protein IPJ81_17380 [Chitinophagaceae bacterium]|nr:hypothetical protein [Chitinophagaceae bacterium]